MKLSEDAVRRLRQVKDQILGKPDSFLMCMFKTNGKSTDYLDGFHPGSGYVDIARCGTAACIAGWLCINELGEETRPPYGFESYAAKLLGVDTYVTSRLFFTDKWPADLRVKFTNPDLTVRAEAAGEVIDRFIAQHS